MPKKWCLLVLGFCLFYGFELAMAHDAPRVSVDLVLADGDVLHLDDISKQQPLKTILGGFNLAIEYLYISKIEKMAKNGQRKNIPQFQITLKNHDSPLMGLSQLHRKYMGIGSWGVAQCLGPLLGAQHFPAKIRFLRPSHQLLVLSLIEKTIP